MGRAPASQAGFESRTPLHLPNTYHRDTETQSILDSGIWISDFNTRETPGRRFGSLLLNPKSEFPNPKFFLCVSVALW